MRQFLGHLQADEMEMDYGPAKELLPAQAFALFRGMSAGDQRHALCVLRVLDRDGEPSQALRRAALLHDVGKACGDLKMWHRVLGVAAGAVDETLLSRLASSDDGLYVQAHHADLGARLCEEVGLSPFVVDLVRYHESPLEEMDDPTLHEALAALKAADDVC
ncbi:MAG: HDIG domain-containing metalloprotein [Anaerolineales bacterium]